MQRSKAKADKTGYSCRPCQEPFSSEFSFVQALETWSRRGVPEDPAGWLYRTARNLAIDALRRERTHAQALPRLAEDAERELAPLEVHFADEIGDAPLRLLFVCCHEGVLAESRVALALRTLCGFSTAEIARAILTTEAKVQKRIERARDRLREVGDMDADSDEKRGAGTQAASLRPLFLPTDSFSLKLDRSKLKLSECTSSSAPASRAAICTART